MKDYNTSGKIITEALSSRRYEAGMIGVIKRNDVYHRVTITDLNVEGQWLVEGDYNGPIEDNELQRFCILTFVKCIPIAYQDWKKIIKEDLDSTKQVSVTVRPSKFKEGKSYQTCTRCSSHFRGAASQPLCKGCCHELAVAYLVLPPVKKTKTKDSAFSREVTESIALESYTKGVNDIEEKDFKNWLKNKLDGTNSDK